eukprot:1737503-Pyramimonas_sp.AAC.1
MGTGLRRFCYGKRGVPTPKVHGSPGGLRAGLLVGGFLWSSSHWDGGDERTDEPGAFQVERSTRCQPPPPK